MKITKSARILSVALALAVFVCGLPFALGASLTASAADAVTIDVSTLTADGKLEISDFAQVGAYDLVGLEIGNTDNGDLSIKTDGDIYYQMNTVDKDLYTPLANPYGIWQVAAESAFSVTFTSTTDVSQFHIEISADGVNYAWADAAVDGQTLSVANVGSKAKFVKVVWPGFDNRYGISQVVYTPATVAANEIDVNFDTASSIVALKSKNLAISGGKVYATNLSSATTAGSWEGSITYAVQPGTRFAMTVTGLDRAWDRKDGTITIGQNLGYGNNGLDFAPEIWGTKDGVNFEKLDVELMYATRYNNNGDTTYGDPDRSIDYNFIVPDDIYNIKVLWPFTQALSSIEGSGFSYSGDDRFYINRVSYTMPEYYYINKATLSPYTVSTEALSTDTMAAYGMQNYGGTTAKSECGFDVGWATSGVNNVFYTYAVEPGTDFTALVRWQYPGLMNALATNNVTYRVQLQGSTGDGTWTEIKTLTFDPTNAAAWYAAAQYDFVMQVEAEENTYNYIRYYFLDKGYVNSSFVGNNGACLAGVDFTAPIVEESTTVADYNYNSSSIDLAAYGVVAQNGHHSVSVTNAGLAPTYSKLCNDAGTTHYEVGYCDKPWVRYEVNPGQTVTVNFQSNDTYVNATPYWIIKVYTAANVDDYHTESVFATTTNGYDTATNAATYHESVSLGSNLYKTTFVVPEGHEYMWIEIPTEGSLKLASNGAFGWAGNDQYYIKSVLITEPVAADDTVTTETLTGNDQMILNGADGLAAYNRVAGAADSIHKVTVKYNTEATDASLAVNVASNLNFANAAVKGAAVALTAGEDQTVTLYAKGDAGFAALMLTAGDTSVVEITDVVIENVDVSGAVASNTASALTDEAVAQEGAQAIRVYAQYNVDANGKVEVNGIKFTLKERGVLLRGYNAETNIGMVIDSNATEALKVSKTADFDKCWSNENGVVVYSNYISGIAVNSTQKYEIRAYVVLELDGVEYVMYSDHHTTSVSELVAGGSTTGDGFQK